MQSVLRSLDTVSYIDRTELFCDENLDCVDGSDEKMCGLCSDLLTLYLILTGRSCSVTITRTVWTGVMRTCAVRGTIPTGPRHATTRYAR